MPNFDDPFNKIFDELAKPYKPTWPEKNLGTHTFTGKLGSSAAVFFTIWAVLELSNAFHYWAESEHGEGSATSIDLYATRISRGWAAATVVAVLVFSCVWRAMAGQKQLDYSGFTGYIDHIETSDSIPGRFKAALTRPNASEEELSDFYRFHKGFLRFLTTAPAQARDSEFKQSAPYAPIANALASIVKALGVRGRDDHGDVRVNIDADLLGPVSPIPVRDRAFGEWLAGQDAVGVDHNLQQGEFNRSNHALLATLTSPPGVSAGGAASQNARESLYELPLIAGNAERGLHGYLEASDKEASFVRQAGREKYNLIEQHQPVSQDDLLLRILSGVNNSQRHPVGMHEDSDSRSSQQIKNQKIILDALLKNPQEIGPDQQTSYALACVNMLIPAINDGQWKNWRYWYASDPIVTSTFKKLSSPQQAWLMYALMRGHDHGKLLVLSILHDLTFKESIQFFEAYTDAFGLSAGSAQSDGDVSNTVIQDLAWFFDDPASPLCSQQSYNSDTRYITQLLSFMIEMPAENVPEYRHMPRQVQEVAPKELADQGDGARYYTKPHSNCFDAIGATREEVVSLLLALLNSQEAFIALPDGGEKLTAAGYLGGEIKALLLKPELAHTMPKAMERGVRIAEARDGEDDAALTAYCCDIGTLRAYVEQGLGYNLPLGGASAALCQYAMGGLRNLECLLGAEKTSALLKKLTTPELVAAISDAKKQVTVNVYYGDGSSNLPSPVEIKADLLADPGATTRIERIWVETESDKWCDLLTMKEHQYQASQMPTSDDDDQADDNEGASTWHHLAQRLFWGLSPKIQLGVSRLMDIGEENFLNIPAKPGSSLAFFESSSPANISAIRKGVRQAKHLTPLVMWLKNPDEDQQKQAIRVLAQLLSGTQKEGGFFQQLLRKLIDRSAEHYSLLVNATFCQDASEILNAEGHPPIATARIAATLVFAAIRNFRKQANVQERINDAQAILDALYPGMSIFEKFHAIHSACTFSTECWDDRHQAFKVMLRSLINEGNLDLDGAMWILDQLIQPDSHPLEYRSLGDLLSVMLEVSVRDSDPLLGGLIEGAVERLANEDVSPERKKGLMLLFMNGLDVGVRNSKGEDDARLKPLADQFGNMYDVLNAYAENLVDPGSPSPALAYKIDFSKYNQALEDLGSRTASNGGGIQRCYIRMAGYFLEAAAIDGDDAALFKERAYGLLGQLFNGRDCFTKMDYYDRRELIKMLPHLMDERLYESAMPAYENIIHRFLYLLVSKNEFEVHKIEQGKEVTKIRYLPLAELGEDGFLTGFVDVCEKAHKDGFSEGLGHFIAKINADGQLNEQDREQVCWRMMALGLYYNNQPKSHENEKHLQPALQGTFLKAHEALAANDGADPGEVLKDNGALNLFFTRGKLHKAFSDLCITDACNKVKKRFQQSNRQKPPINGGALHSGDLFALEGGRTGGSIQAGERTPLLDSKGVIAPKTSEYRL
jgi:hypothetical protein